MKRENIEQVVQVIAGNEDFTDYEIFDSSFCTLSDENLNLKPLQHCHWDVYRDLNKVIVHDPSIDLS